MNLWLNPKLRVWTVSRHEVRHRTNTVERIFTGVLEDEQLSELKQSWEMFKLRPARWRDLIKHPEYLVDTSERPHLWRKAKLASSRMKAIIDPSSQSLKTSLERNKLISE